MLEDSEPGADFVPQHPASREPTSVVEKGDRASEDPNERGFASVHVANNSDPEIKVVPLAWTLAHKRKRRPQRVAAAFGKVLLCMHQGTFTLDCRSNLCEARQHTLHLRLGQRTNSDERLAVTVGRLAHAVFPRRVLLRGHNRRATRR